MLAAPEWPASARRFVAVAVGFLALSLVLLVVLILGAAVPGRALTFGYDISPLAGLYFVVSAVALLVVAIVEADDLASSEGLGRSASV